MAKPHVLIITPAASRSGAPMLALHLIRWLRAHGDFKLSGVLVSGGAMEAELSAELPTAVFEVTRRSKWAALRWLQRRRMFARWARNAAVRRCRAVAGEWPPDLVYCNSAVSADVLEQLGPYTCPVVMNLHELPYALQVLGVVRDGAIPAITRHTTRFMAGSRSVATALTDCYAVPAEHVTVIHDFLDVSSVRPTSAYSALVQATPAASDIRGQHGIPVGALVVGFIATVEWRKGADLLVALARATFARAGDLPVHFVWIGGGASVIDVVELKMDVAKADLGDRVHVLGPTNRTADWYPVFSLFTLLSREDPFPLVCLEAASYALPIVCFANGGGISEFVEDDAGVVVPYLDLNAMADAILRLLADEATRTEMGRVAARKVQARHDTSVAGPAVKDLFHSLLATRRRPGEAS